MPMNLDETHFREVERTDSDRLTTFFTENNVAQVTDTFTAFPLNRDTAAWIAKYTGKDKYYLLLRGEAIVGLSMLRGFDEGYAVPSFGIIIDHRAQGLGFGRYLLSETVEQARLMGCPKVRLSVYGCNISGRKIYEAIGFKEIDRENVLRNGIPDDKIIMIKDLE